MYCAVIIECMRLHDIGRASEWTAALGDWCDAQPELVPYRGQCLVHRSQLQQIAGRWSEAITTAGAACRYLAIRRTRLSAWPTTRRASFTASVVTSIVPRRTTAGQPLRVRPDTGHRTSRARPE